MMSAVTLNSLPTPAVRSIASELQRDKDRIVASGLHKQGHISLLWQWIKLAVTTPESVNVHPIAHVGPGAVGITIVGHATVRLQYPKHCILTDPVVTNWVGPVRRAVKAGMATEDRKKVTVILLSGNVLGLYHRPSLKKLPKTAVVVCPDSLVTPLRRLGFSHIVPLQWGQQHYVDDLEIVAVATNTDTTPINAYIVRGGGPTIFYCGQSGYFSGFRSVGNRYHPDIVLLPIGGFLPKSFQKQNMTPVDALLAFCDTGAQLCIPIRHSHFAFSYEPLLLASDWMRTLVSQYQMESYVRILPEGDPVRFVASGHKQVAILQKPISLGQEVAP